MMGILEALLYGAVQGLTEYLPVSSSAHLILLPRFLGTTDPGLSFDVFLHLGTLAATLFYFRRDWVVILRGALTRKPVTDESPDASPHWTLIAAATLPALAMGGLFHHQIETVFRGNTVLIATLSLGGVLFYGFDRVCSRARTLGSFRMKDALWVGLAQCFSLVPGVSRSGSTIMGGRLLGFNREAAARFSFLISAPVTLAAIVFEFRNWRELLATINEPLVLLVAGLSSFAFGILAIGGLLRIVRRFDYLPFALYRVLLALVIWKTLGV